MPKKELPILGKFMLRLLYVLVLALLGCCAFLFYKMETYDTSIGDLQKEARESRAESAQRERAFNGMKSKQEKEAASRNAGISYIQSALGYETEEEKYSDLTRLSKHVIDHTSGINKNIVDPPMDSDDLNVKNLLNELVVQIAQMKAAEASAKEKEGGEEALYALCETLGYTSVEEDDPDLQALSDTIKKDLSRINREGISPPLSSHRLTVKALLSEMTRRIAVLMMAVAEKTLVIENLQSELDKK